MLLVVVVHYYMICSIDNDGRDKSPPTEQIVPPKYEYRGMVRGTTQLVSYKEVE